MLMRDHKPRKSSLIIVGAASLVLVFMIVGFPSSSDRSASIASAFSITASSSSLLQEHDCYRSEQGSPVFANKVEGVKHPFFISIADLGSAEKPNRNFLRMIKGKLFQKPEISGTIQKVLEQQDRGALVVDVGANVGMAAFAAAAMGFRVLAFEPVVENLNKLCDGVYLNRVGHLVKLFQAAISDSPGSITLHKVIGRLDNSAISLAGAKLAFKDNSVEPFTVATWTLDSVISDQTQVALLKVDVQGWEFHVLEGAQKLLSRPAASAPYVIYEEDDRLLAESNSSSTQILRLLTKCGYSNCRKLGNDRHCYKSKG